MNLKEQWDKGRKEAERLLQNFYGHPFNFETKFQNSNYDLLKPLGSYVGVSATADDAHSEEERDPCVSSICIRIIAGTANKC